MPAPVDSSVYIQHVPQTRVYSYSYSGFSSTQTIMQHALDVISVLDAQPDACYDATTIYAAGYDPPYRLIGRHNEVWIPAAECSSKHKAKKPSKANKP